MLLTLRAGEAEQRYWVTRRLWLALYERLAALAPAAIDEEAEPPPPKPSPAMAPDAAAQPVLLESVRLRRVEAGTRLVFSGGGTTVNMTLRELGLARCKRMLELQADRAGWDTAAAIERIQAGALAGAVVQRARH